MNTKAERREVQASKLRTIRAGTKYTGPRVRKYKGMANRVKPKGR